MDNVGIEFISVLGMSPVKLVELAAELGCRYITTAPQSHGESPEGHPSWSLKEDANLRRDFIAALRANGVSVSLGEGCAIFPDFDVRDAYPGALDTLREVGATRINSVAFGGELARNFDQLGALAEMAAARGMETFIEFVPTFGIADLPTALAAIKHVGRRDCRLLIDTMHFGRSGAKPADLAAVDPNLIGYIQLCDAPRVAKIESYMEEAMYERRVPGEGELPLRDMLAALPRDLVVGLEIPMRAEAQSGVGPKARMKRAVDAARKLLASLKA